MAEEYGEEELERASRRRERVERMKREKERRLKFQKICRIALPALGFILVFAAAAFVRAASAKSTDEAKIPDGADVDARLRIQTDPSARAGNALEKSRAAASAAQNGGAGLERAASENDSAREPSVKTYSAHATADTLEPPEEVKSPNAIFIDLESGDILAQRGYREVVSPASMTKVLTVLVASEHVTDLDDTFTMTIDITDYSYSNDCSSVGFAVGETVTVRDLFYGTILPSGGDAALALAIYVAGSHENFVEMMNAEAERLGLSETAHFANCIGLYDEDHHCTVYDMAMIMEAALDDEFCREVLGAHVYTTSKTAEHPEGITISNWFLRRIEDKDTGGEVICAKTGYVVESKSCAVSYGADRSGREYVCVTAGAEGAWRCIYDHVALYKTYARE